MDDDVVSTEATAESVTLTDAVIGVAESVVYTWFTVYVAVPEPSTVTSAAVIILLTKEPSPKSQSTKIGDVRLAKFAILRGKTFAVGAARP